MRIRVNSVNGAKARMLASFILTLCHPDSRYYCAPKYNNVRLPLEAQYGEEDDWLALDEALSELQDLGLASRKQSIVIDAYVAMRDWCVQLRKIGGGKGHDVATWHSFCVDALSALADQPTPSKREVLTELERLRVNIRHLDGDDLIDARNRVDVLVKLLG